jgi:iron-sulfur cluster assembly protein
MITVSEKAKARIVQLMEEQSYDNSYFLRVGVESGGCSGLSYKLDFDNEPKNGDETFEFDGIKVVTDKRSVLYLFGTELDFSDGLNGKGFAFNNPNASRTCSCGESFAV